MNNNDRSFRPKARIILQLGDQLIRSESIAVLELIKNSYDACASQVILRLKNIDSNEDGEIIIEDDGHGMSCELIKSVWLVPGTTFKKSQIDERRFIDGCNRIPLGEKGIGRFGVHKLGEEIEMISKAKGEQETRLLIRWSDFDNDRMLDDIPLDLTERDPITFPNGKTGTKIIIRKLRTNWTRGGVRNLYRAVNSLNSPFTSLESFRVKFRTDRASWLEGLLSFSDIEDSALFSAEATLEGNMITSLNYDFTPWPVMQKHLQPRSYSAKDIAMVQRVFNEIKRKKVQEDIDLDKHKIGKVKIKLLIFDLDRNVLSMGVSDKRGLKAYLRDNGGMRVYRDDVRVYDYGEPGNDWLNLDIERVNLPSARISNNLVIGAINLDRLASSDLKEKTNREGFIENDAFRTFYSAIRFTIAQIVVQRNIDKDKIRSHFSGGKGKITVTDNLALLREKVDSYPLDPIIQDELLAMIDEISADYKSMSEVYIRSASAGLSLSIVIHEIEKIITELLYVVEDQRSGTDNSERIRSLTWHMGKLIEGYSGLIQRRSQNETDLITIIQKALWNIQFRLEAHEVTVIEAFKEKKPFETLIKCSNSLIVGTIINIIDNSIWWMSYGKIQNQKIWVDISNEREGYITILIADNGPGFTLPVEEVIKPFISNKEGGIGIGLHIAHEIMESHGGDLLFPEVGEFDIPQEFENGARVGLSFKITKLTKS
jgi:signal transduction histidine kinase